MKQLILILTMMTLSSCASFNKNLKAFLSGEEPKKTETAQAAPKDEVVKYSDVQNMPANQDREYRRMTKKQFEEQELFNDNAGSLWTMEGQDSYLFSQNIVRLPGDIVNVQLDGQPEKQLTTKANVIKDLTDKIEKARMRDVAGTPDAAKPAAPGADAAAKPGADKTAAAKPDDKAGADAAGGNFDVKTVPTRIVERMSDGSYRVKGAQTFMIGPKEYKVIVTGLVKPADIGDDSVAASKMMDSKFDIVRYSSNSKGKTL